MQGLGRECSNVCNGISVICYPIWMACLQIMIACCFITSDLQKIQQDFFVDRRPIKYK